VRDLAGPGRFRPTVEDLASRGSVPTGCPTRASWSGSPPCSGQRPSSARTSARRGMASWAPGGDPSRRIELDLWPTALAKWDLDKDGKLSRAEIKDNEVLDRFFRMDLNQDGVLEQSEWEHHAQFFSKAKNSMLAIKPSGKGELPDSAVTWQHMRGAPYVSTPVLDHGILYMVKEGGIVTKLDLAKQTLLQEERVPGVGNYFSSPVAGDGKVYLANESGLVSILASQPDWKVLSSHEFHERMYATPAFGPGCIYLRTEKALYCLQATP